MFKVGDRVESKARGYKGIITDLTGHDGSEGLIRIKRDDGEDGSQKGTGKWAMDRNQMKLIRRGRPTKPKPVQFIVKYDENDVDPYKEFHSRKELMKWIKEAQKDSDIDFSSILVFPVLEPKRVTTKFGLRKA